MPLGPRSSQPARGGVPLADLDERRLLEHFSKTSGQRVRNRQPVGIAVASGVSPTRIVRFWRSPSAGGSGDGATDTSAAVYGCLGFEITSFAGPISMIRRGTSRPPVRDHPCSDRSWVMNR